MADAAAIVDASRGAPAGWARLSRYLVANLYACDPDGKELTDQPRILAPANDVQFRASFNWQSPFENAGPETKAPALMALIQSGQLGPVVSALQSRLPDGMRGGAVDRTLESVQQGAKNLEGRTGITRLNSRQVFSGMPPIKITLTLHLRAFSDPETEVMQPYQRLLEWALPQELAQDGVLSEVIQNATDGASLLKAMFPSKAPQMVGFVYANNRYVPMVIEDVSHPLDGPTSENGLPLYRAVQVSLATLTALDRTDVVKIFARG